MTASNEEAVNPNTEDKMSWKPGEVVWTRQPSAAQQLANRQAASRGKKPPAPRS